jgi:hypothetical protein
MASLVDQLYLTSLGREAKPEEKAFWENQAASGANIAAAIAGSPEAQSYASSPAQPAQALQPQPLPQTISSDNNAILAAMQGMGAQYSSYGGDQVRVDDSYKRTLAEGAAALGISPQAYDQMINPSTYGARWGIASTTTPSQQTQTTGRQASYTSPAAPTASAATAPSSQPFQSAQFNFEADPGYAFRKQQGEDAMQKRQLASGNFFSGGALKEASDFGSALASQEYGNAFQRYLSNDANSYRNHQSNFSNDLTLDNTGYSRALTADNTNYGRWVDDYNRNVNA